MTDTFCVLVMYKKYLIKVTLFLTVISHLELHQNTACIPILLLVSLMPSLAKHAE